MGYKEVYKNDVLSTTDVLKWKTELTHDDNPPATQFTPRTLHQVVMFKNKMWLLGGWDRYYTNDVWSSVDGKTWTRETANANWDVRMSHQVVVFRNKLWVLGGASRYGSVKNDVWSSADGKTWTRETANADWSVRSSHQVVVFKNKMWLLGGYDGKKDFNDVWSFDGKTWTPETANADWSGRGNHRVVVFKNKMWLLGGHGDKKRLNDVWSFDGKTWTPETMNADWSARTAHQVVVFHDKMWLLGGYDDKKRLNDVWSFDGKTWTPETANADWSTRTTHQVVVFHDKMWLLGGGHGYENGKNDVLSSADGKKWDLELAHNENPPATKFRPRSKHQVLVFNGRMWIIGRSDRGRITNDVWSSTDGKKWDLELAHNETPASTQFTPRYGHQAVVFNGHMWLIGGRDKDYKRLNDVWSSTDGKKWDLELAHTDTPASTQFTPRYNHQAVVFNGRMWIIGGRDKDYKKLNDVWSFDGKTKTWTQELAHTDNPPATQFTPRHSHQAVVFDGKMWVIGGFDGQKRFNDVWSFDGKTKTWTQELAHTDTPASTQFSPRYAHKVIVFNGRMWVMGGRTPEMEDANTWKSKPNKKDIWSSVDGKTWVRGHDYSVLSQSSKKVSGLRVMRGKKRSSVLAWDEDAQGWQADGVDLVTKQGGWQAVVQLVDEKIAEAKIDEKITQAKKDALNTAIPLGFIYIQFPSSQQSPRELWGGFEVLYDKYKSSDRENDVLNQYRHKIGKEMIWLNISSKWPGYFFRVENYPNYVLGNSQQDTVKTGTQKVNTRCDGGHDMVVGAHTGYKSSADGNCSATIDLSTGSETRPVNYAIRIWKRIA